MVLQQRCNSTGSSIDSDTDCVIQNPIYRHRCTASVFYYKNQMESKECVFNDENNVTRCKQCGKKWGFYVQK
jgi:hypothetical protein